MRYRLIGGRHDYIQGNRILTVRCIPSKFAKFFGAKEKDVEYIGYSTVWRELHTMRRVCTTIEALLCDFNEVYERNQPQVHLRKDHEQPQ